MKPLKILLLLLFPILSYSQEITSNVVDPFTNERTIQTDIVPIKQGLSNGFGVSFTAINNSYYLNILGYGGDNKAIKEDDKLWFVLEDGNVVQFNSRVDMDANESDVKNIYIHHYFARLGDLENLKNKKLAVFRVKTGDGVTDIKISKKTIKNFSKLIEVFYKEINKQPMYN